MSWNTLIADPTFIREGNDDVLNLKFTDEDLENLLLTSSKREMKSDLISAWRLDESSADDMTYLDNIVTKNLEKLKIVLAYKQLYKYYFMNHGGSESKTYERMKQYYMLYEGEKQYFERLRSDDLSVSKSIYVLRG
jgi:hypothetical protein